MRLNRVTDIDATGSWSLCKYSVAGGLILFPGTRLLAARRLHGASGPASRGLWGFSAVQVLWFLFSCHWCVPSNAGTHWAPDTHPPRGPHLPHTARESSPQGARSLQQQVLGHCILLVLITVGPPWPTNCRSQKPFPQHLPLQCHLLSPLSPHLSPEQKCRLSTHHAALRPSAGAH